MNMPNRMKGIINNIISLQQVAFISGRKIQDSIVVVHESFHYLDRKKKDMLSHMAIKLDLNKDFDRLQQTVYCQKNNE